MRVFNVERMVPTLLAFPMKKVELVFAVLVLVACSCPAQNGEPQSRSQQGTIHVNGTDLFYETIGTGTPIVVVHGGPGLDHTYLLPQMATLAKQYKLVFYDQRASGKSAGAVDTNSMTMGNFVEDLEGVRKAFGLTKMNLIGHSWGGLVAMFYAVKYPDHLRSLMLINSSPASVLLRYASFAVMARRTTRGDSIAQASLVATQGFKNRDPQAMARFFRILFRGSFYDPRMADSLTLTLDTSFATKSRILQYLNRDTVLASYDLFPKLSVIHCPTLIVSGDHDMVTPEATKKLHESIPGSSLIVFDNCGHFPFIEVPKQFFGALEAFLGPLSD
jgi:proline iminopeptidase